jgi:hypothetical protein
LPTIRIDGPVSWRRDRLATYRGRRPIAREGLGGIDARSESQPRRSLAGHISIRVAVVALVTSLVQLLVVIGTHRIDYDDLALDHVRREAEWLSRGIKPVPGGLAFELSGNMSHYGDGYQDGYAFRILDRSGQIIAFQTRRYLEGASPWQRMSCESALGFWFRKLDDSRQFYFAAVGDST